MSVDIVLTGTDIQQERLKMEAELERAQGSLKTVRTFTAKRIGTPTEQGWQERVTYWEREVHKLQVRVACMQIAERAVRDLEAKTK